jgi:peptide deformylase
MVLAIHKLGDPVLRYPVPEGDIDPAELKTIIKDMTDTLREAKGLGLAAPQVGILKRIFVYDMGDGLRVMLNPQVVWQSAETEEDTEGCLSIPGGEVTVRRCTAVRITAHDEVGQVQEIEAEGLLARMLQHEIDHLNGVMIIDRTTEEERRRLINDMIREDRE